MKNDRIDITDELIACYLEGKVTDEERAAVEAYLSEDDEAMDAVILSRAEMDYQDDVVKPTVFGQSMSDYNLFAWAASSAKKDCAIRAQQMVLRNYGVEVSLEELTELAEKKGWFDPEKGSAFDFVGELLNHYGVEAVQMRNAGIYHIMHELSQGHKIIVGTDAEDTDEQQHVMLVAGIDTSDPDHLKVTVNDPSDPGRTVQLTANEFMERWENTGCFMVSTKQPAPLAANPEMAHFDYELGYVRKFADVAYEEIVKRLVEDGVIPDTKSQGRRKTRFYVIGVAVLALVGLAAYLLWRFATPLHMKVNVVEDAAYSIPSLPFERGELQCEYAGNALQTIEVSADNKTVFLNDIPYKYRNSEVHLVFRADGYEPIDTTVKVGPAVSLNLRRNDDLGVVFGRVTDFQTGDPVEGAVVQLKDLTATTDAFGQFRIEIPFAQQDKTQRVTVVHEGHQVWAGMYRPSATEPWMIPLTRVSK